MEVETEEEKGEEKEIIKEEKTNKSKLVKWLGVIFLPFTWIGFFILLWQTEISFLFPFLISLALSVIELIMIFNFKIFESIKKYRKKEEKEKIPEPASEEVILEALEKVFKDVKFVDNGDHIKNYAYQEHTIGKNRIGIFQVELLYGDNKLIGKRPFVIINENFPHYKPTVVHENTKIPTLRYLINKKSTNPEEAPDIEKGISLLPTGTILQTEKKYHRRKPRQVPLKESVI